MYFDINLKLLSGKNTQKVNKQKIQDSENWMLDELNKICNYSKLILPLQSVSYQEKFWQFYKLILRDNLEVDPKLEESFHDQWKCRPPIVLIFRYMYLFLPNFAEQVELLRVMSEIRLKLKL